MLNTFLRTIIMYLFVVFALRIMGKRQLSDFEPSELVVTIMMSEVAALPVQDNSQPLLSSILIIVALLIFEIVLSFSAYRIGAVRKLIYGTPSVFFEKGKINVAEMEKQRFSVTDLMEAIRNEGYSTLSEVDYIIMETNGNISVIPSAPSRPVSPSDLGIKAEEMSLSYVLIDDGSLYENNLKRLGFNLEWLKAQLERKNVKSPKEVFYFSADKDGNTFLVKKDDKKVKK